MKKNNRSNYTINFTRKALNLFSRLTSLKEPEAIKMVIADMKDVTNGYKRNLCIAYNKYCKHYETNGKMEIGFRGGNKKRRIRVLEPVKSSLFMKPLLSRSAPRRGVRHRT
jgi:hypothetical protein